MIVVIAKTKNGKVMRLTFTNEANARKYCKNLVLRKTKILSFIKF